MKKRNTNMHDNFFYWISTKVI